MRLRSLLTPGLLLLATSTLLAENWPQFRGPTGQGHATAVQLPTEWDETQNISWMQDIPGLGWSSPIYWEGKLYLTTSVDLESGEGQSLRALCLDAKTGEILWNHEIFQQRDGARVHSKNSHASPTPITDGKHLYVHFGPHGTACLTMQGKVVWKQTELDYPPVHGNGGSPVLVEGLLIVSCDGAESPFVVALDQKTGEVVWKKARPDIDRSQKFSFSTPLVIEVNGQLQVISSGSDVVIAYEPKTGEEIWQVDFSGYSVVPRPVSGNGLVYLCTGFNNASLMAIDPTGRGNVTSTHVDWTVDRSVSLTPSPLLVGKELYLIDDRGIGTCLDAKSGEVIWRERIGGKFSASPVYADGKIYLQSEEGETIVIAPGRTFQLLARNELPGRTFASFAIAENAIFLRSEDRLYRIESKQSASKK